VAGFHEIFLEHEAASRRLSEAVDCGARVDQAIWAHRRRPPVVERFNTFREDVARFEVEITTALLDRAWHDASVRLPAFPTVKTDAAVDLGDEAAEAAATALIAAGLIHDPDGWHWLGAVDCRQLLEAFLAPVALLAVCRG
jgi:hypothetical protein